MITTQELKEIFEIANLQAQAQTYANLGSNVMVYPCGFAWVYLKVRKNDKLGKQLEQAKIMSWDSYRKYYMYWVGDYNQSAKHKEYHATKLAELLSIELGQKIGYDSRLD